MIPLLYSGLDYKSLSLPKLSNHRPCNPSITVYNDQLFATYRGCNYNLREEGYRFWYGSSPARVPDSQNYIARISADMAVLSTDFLEDRHLRLRPSCLDGLEDLRLFCWKGELYVSGTGMYNPDERDKPRNLRASMLLGKISKNRIEFIAEFKTKQSVEKNWMPWVIGKDLHFIYLPEPLTILKYSLPNGAANTKLTTLKPLNSLNLPKSSGSSCVVPHEDYFLAVLHCKDGLARNAKYSHFMIKISKEFQILAVSKMFTFEGESIEFCAGLAIQGDFLYLSYGVFDSRAMIARFRSGELLHYMFG